MNAGRQHRCGGRLWPAWVQILDAQEGFVVSYRVPGFICDKCHEELIDRDTASKVQGSQIPSLALPETATSSRLDPETVKTLPAGASSLAAAA